MNLLLCTLGASWAVVPEVFGFVAPEVLDLYAFHPDRRRLDALREQNGLLAPDEIWVVTTEGEQACTSVGRLKDWRRSLGATVPLRIWRAAGTNQLASQDECDRIRELVMRVVMLAAERCREGQLLLSLAGGRKTMSADLQTAGSLFGAHAWLHVVGPEPLPDQLRKAEDPELFVSPLPPGLAATIVPLVVGRGHRNELLDLELDGRRADSVAFPLPIPDDEISWTSPGSTAHLTAEIDRRLRESGRLLGTFFGALAREEPRDNWRSLFRLGPERIDELRRTHLTQEHRAWLCALPKADLHRHLGGSLDLAAQRRVGRAIWESLDSAARHVALDDVAGLLKAKGDWPWDWPTRIGGDLRSARVAALLVEATEEQLQRNLYGVTEPRIALRAGPRGFPAYERPGELTGSAVLTHPAALQPYAEALCAQARAEGLVYVELRGSPHKYWPQDPAGFLQGLRQALGRASAGAITFGFVWILDRRQREAIPHVIGQAVQAHEMLEGFLVGLDLAGDEGTQRPDELAPHFNEAFRECLHITIHAGEGESVENIWQAAYALHADRVGHGLTLLENPRLAARFRDRGICIELCPTSNLEVVGFRDPDLPSTHSFLQYPLRGLLDAGLPVAICTDNPGISRTTLSDEFLAAARMGGGLTLWETLAVVRSGFAHAFLPASQREKLLAEADAALLERVDYPGAVPQACGGLT